MASEEELLAGSANLPAPAEEELPAGAANLPDPADLPAVSRLSAQFPDAQVVPPPKVTVYRPVAPGGFGARPKLVPHEAVRHALNEKYEAMTTPVEV